MLRYKKELILNTVLSFFLLALYMVTPILEQKIIDEEILSKVAAAFRSSLKVEALSHALRLKHLKLVVPLHLQFQKLKDQIISKLQWFCSWRCYYKCELKGVGLSGVFLIIPHLLWYNEKQVI